jgi:hypothetical protein
MLHKTCSKHTSARKFWILVHAFGVAILCQINDQYYLNYFKCEDLDGPAISALQRAIAKAKHLGYGPLSQFIIHTKGLCSSYGDINELIMMMILNVSCPYRRNMRFLG